MLRATMKNGGVVLPVAGTVIVLLVRYKALEGDRKGGPGLCT